jgi:hypothetical protein
MKYFTIIVNESLAGWMSNVYNAIRDVEVEGITIAPATQEVWFHLKACGDETHESISQQVSVLMQGRRHSIIQDDGSRVL